ncbi:H(+)-transporting V1 sector ATPase subunit H [Pseudogymnoascus australis]
MSLEPPTYLSSLRNNIRARPIPWDGAVRAGTITEEQLGRIRAVDKVRKDQRKQTVEAEVEAYRSLFLGGEGERSILEKAARRADVVQYVLVLLGDLLEGSQALVDGLLEHENTYAPFLPLLAQATSPEEAIPLLTSTALTTLLARESNTNPKGRPASDEALPILYKYLSTLAKSSDSGLQDIAVMGYSSLLRSRRSRELFWESRDVTIEPLISILRTAAGVSASGESAASLWDSATTRTGGGLSFEGVAIGDGLEDEYDVIPLFTQLLRLSPKEKTTRLLVSTLYNLISGNPKTLLPAAALVRLPTLLQNVNGRHHTDPDLIEDLTSLTELLEEHTKTQTTFDQYAAEVDSGHLRWSPPHRNTVFWAENARRILEQDNGRLPKKLAEIIAKPWDNDKQVLAIACNDLGCLVKEVPEKRQQLERLGLKTRIMELMAEPDESVRWESLRAVGEWLRYSFETR